MKKVFFLSGIASIVMTIFIISGKIDLNNYTDIAIYNGNKFYMQQKYDKAEEEYNKAYKVATNNPTINYNLGLALYQLDNFKQAAEHLKLSEDNYMVLGNALYRQGSGGKANNQQDSSQQVSNKKNSIWQEGSSKQGNILLGSSQQGNNQQDSIQQITLYQQALEQYLTGIKAYPNDIELKYNYEFVKKIIDDINKQNQQNQDPQEQNQQRQNGENQEGQSQGENQDEQSEGGQNQDEQSQDYQNQEGQSQKQNQDEQSEGGENQDQQSQDNNNQDEQSQEEQSQDQSNINRDNQTGQKNLDDKTIQQILNILEQQEEQSLKNNQSVKDKGKEDTYGW